MAKELVNVCGVLATPSQIDELGNVPQPRWEMAVAKEKRHDPKEVEEEQRVIQPMMWGLVPPWHKGPDPKGGSLTNTFLLLFMKHILTYMVT